MAVESSSIGDTVEIIKIGEIQTGGTAVDIQIVDDLLYMQITLGC